MLEEKINENEVQINLENLKIKEDLKKRKQTLIVLGSIYVGLLLTSFAILGEEKENLSKNQKLNIYKTIAPADSQKYNTAAIDSSSYVLKKDMTANKISTYK